MAVVIDDRVEVWEESSQPHILQVRKGSNQKVRVGVEEGKPALRSTGKEAGKPWQAST